MAQTTAVLSALKQNLRAQGKTYVDVANKLGLSEASVKRLFARQAFSLKRVDAICALLGIELTDLIQQVASEAEPLGQLSIEQEAAIASDIPLLLVTVAVLNRMTIEDILARFSIDIHDCVRKLAWLDRVGIIDLLPANRIRLRVAANFAWIAGGPIQRFFLERLSAEYFRANFRSESESLVVLNGMLGGDDLARFQARMQRVIYEFNELSANSTARPLAERTGYTAVLAVRPWVFGAFSDYLRG